MGCVAGLWAGAGLVSGSAKITGGASELSEAQVAS